MHYVNILFVYYKKVVYLKYFFLIQTESAKPGK